MTQDSFIKLNGIHGNSQDERHKGAIDMLWWRWGVHNSSKNGHCGRFTVNDLVFDHYTDTASPALLRYCASGKHLSEAVITLRKPGNPPLEYIRIVLQDIIITRVHTVCYNTMRAPREKVGLSFSQFRLDYRLHNSADLAAGTASMGYDIKTRQMV
ncbi:Hcp family type VI secretion system effector [Erwinia oleae]|uniref:Hcp family type VI secretion system effector n=1 Tax=Erwinia oleae TaxID=796334 RepID=UPI000557761C|nr:type VI secretion system tube protein Hcp [Erwinia oleae]